MKAHAIFRLGRDVSLNRLPNGDAVANLTLATNVRKGQEDIAVWVDAALFGKRAESLAPYLLKGTQILADLDGLHMQTYEGKNGPGTKLAARIHDITLVGSKKEGQEPAPPRPPPAPAPPAAPPPAPVTAGFEVDDDDIPF